VKLLTTLLLATLAALAVYSARRRIVFALKTGAVVYIVLLFGRLLLSAGSLGDRWEDLIWPVFFMLIGWVILWRVSTTYEERRSKSLRSASEAGRRGRRFR
jgi:asparagine N-glycosylation enzyme membrane subunit Stt3